VLQVSNPSAGLLVREVLGDRVDGLGVVRCCPRRTAAEAGDAIEVEVEVDRVVNRNGIVILAGQAILAADILAGCQVSIRIEPDTLMFFDPASRELRTSLIP
jgi:hypothetical protein